MTPELREIYEEFTPEMREMLAKDVDNTISTKEALINRKETLSLQAKKKIKYNEDVEKDLKVGDDTRKIIRNVEEKNKYIYNWTVAMSNLVAAIPAICAAKTTMDYVVVISMALVSFTYHLAETKHNLPGLHIKILASRPFLRRYAKLLLNLDRFFAWSTIAYMFYKADGYCFINSLFFYRGNVAILDSRSDNFYCFLEWLQKRSILPIGGCGLIFLALSELVPLGELIRRIRIMSISWDDAIIINKWWFTITHCLWHFCAFRVLAFSFT